MYNLFEIHADTHDKSVSNRLKLFFFCRTKNRYINKYQPTEKFVTLQQHTTQQKQKIYMVIKLNESSEKKSCTCATTIHLFSKRMMYNDVFEIKDEKPNSTIFSTPPAPPPPYMQWKNFFYFHSHMHMHIIHKSEISCSIKHRYIIDV